MVPTKNTTPTQGKEQEKIKNQNKEVVDIKKEEISNLKTDLNTENPKNIKKDTNEIQKEHTEATVNDKEKDNGLTVVNNSPNDITIPNYNDYEGNSKKSPKSILPLIAILIFVILFLAFSIFTVYNTTSDTIANGVFIKGVDVSGLSKESALKTINTFINEHSSDEIILEHNEYQNSISLEQISAKFDIDSAVEQAYSINKEGNMFENSFKALKLLIIPTNIEPIFTCDEEQLTKNLEDISPNLPDTIIESGYYIEDNTLIVTKGKKGNVVNVPQMKEFVKYQIYNLNFRDKPLNIITSEKTPEPIDIEKIYNEVHKESKDAYFTQEPFALYPSETGIDFAISLEEAKNLLDTQEDECHIPLKVLYPNVTTNMIGNEAFPDKLSEYSTKYVANANRTTNLIIAANKINGTVVMPGETFSYNKVVGERTIAAGYKDAAIYVDGKTVDGLAGGICQVSTTLYEAALYANLEIVERRNHQFVPTYVGPGLDATVVYGLTDFKFKNNRNYPIKILCSVSNGICNFQILGLATADDYVVEISASHSTTATSINAVTYKTLKRNGQVVSKEIISRDTYKRH